MVLQTSLASTRPGELAAWVVAIYDGGGRRWLLILLGIIVWLATGQG